MVRMMKCKYIDGYIQEIRSGKIHASKELKQAMDYIEKKLDDSDVFIDVEKIEKAVELIERYFDIKLLNWELFILSLVHCYYKSDDTVVFSEFLIVMGRGNGKNGFISGLAWYLTTKYHGVQGYNVDIIANSEEQAKTSFDDIYNVLTDTWAKSKKFFYKTKEVIKSLKTKSYIKFNTSNAKTKDGKRSACLIFDEIHEYETSDTIKVFRSGFGKRKHSRIFNITTNGYVREGVLDEKLRIAHDVLNGIIPQSRLCPLIYKLDSDEEADNPELWVKANPSLPYMPLLKLEMEQEYIDKQYDKDVELDFFTKRMNLPRSDREIAVTDWKNIEATNKELPDLSGWSCVVGIDYAALSDWASVNLHFRSGELRYDINHSWICAQSKTLDMIKAPWRVWAEEGKVTVVDDVEISPELLTAYIDENMSKYNVLKVALDNHRFALVSRALEKIGFTRELGNVYIVRPSDIMRVQPVIDSCFNRQYFFWGDYAPLRWATNNTKLVRAGKKNGTDTGNFYYAKIEAKSRKTDPFMALAASMTVEEELGDGGSNITPEFTVYTY